MQNILERINQSLDNLGAPPLMKRRHEYLAKLVGTTTRTVRRWFSEQVMIPKTNLNRLAEALNVNYQWLENGEGCQRKIPDYICLDKNEGIIPILTWGSLGAITPNIQACYLQFYPESSGAAAGLLGTIQLAMDGCMSAISVWVANGALMPIVLTMGICVLLNIFFMWRVAKETGLMVHCRITPKFVG